MTKKKKGLNSRWSGSRFGQGLCEISKKKRIEILVRFALLVLVCRAFGFRLRVLRNLRCLSRFGLRKD